MNDLRDIARELRHEPDAAMVDRVRAGVRARMATAVSPWDVLAAWLRPAAISFAAVLALLVAVFVFVPDRISPDEMASLAGRVLIGQEVTLDGR